MYLLYTVFYALALLITLPYWVARMIQSGKYRAGLKERFGRIPQRLSLPPGGQHSIWFHAVSVGEVLAISPLVRELKNRVPDTGIYVSTTTRTGQTLARERFGAANVFYMPLDLPFAIHSVLRAINPSLLVLAETEFWPNVIRLARTNGARIAVVNARISDRSYPGYRRFRRFLSPVLNCIDLFLTQSEVDAQRLREIGAPPGRVRITGNLKFDIQPPSDSELTRALRPRLSQDRPILLCGSTVEGEEALLIPCFREILSEFPGALIILAPRHPERFDSIAELLRASGIGFVRRSSWTAASAGTNETTFPAGLGGDVLLLDTIGELASAYSLATLAFVGGSLVARGGHNILEPAYFAKPMLIGPHYENFREIVREFLEKDAVRVVTPEQLTPAALKLLHCRDDCQAIGQRAAALVAEGRGSTQRTLEALLELRAGGSAHEAELVSARQ